MDAFVDDTTSWTNRFMESIRNHEVRTEDTVRDIQQAAQWWEELLTEFYCNNSYFRGVH